jgi:hypothetical protein
MELVSSYSVVLFKGYTSTLRKARTEIKTAYF